MQKPSLGRIVIAHIDPTLNDGQDEAPAIITRVEGEHPDGGWVVSLALLLSTPSGVMTKNRVRLVEQRSRSLGGNIGRAWWPPRV